MFDYWIVNADIEVCQWVANSGSNYVKSTASAETAIWRTLRPKEVIARTSSFTRCAMFETSFDRSLLIPHL
jgi:hypothetical protein